MKGNRIKEIRARKRMTQFRVGMEAEIVPSRLSLIENSYVKPREDEVKRLSKALGVPADELFPSAEGCAT